VLGADGRRARGAHVNDKKLKREDVQDGTLENILQGNYTR